MFFAWAPRDRRILNTLEKLKLYTPKGNGGRELG